MKKFNVRVIRHKRMPFLFIFLALFFSLVAAGASTRNQAMASFDNSSNEGESVTRLRGMSKKDHFPQKRKSNHKFFSVKEERNDKTTSKFDSGSPNYIIPKDGYKEGEILVKFKQKVSDAIIDSVHNKLGAKVKKHSRKHKYR